MAIWRQRRYWVWGLLVIGLFIVIVKVSYNPGRYYGLVYCLFTLETDHDYRLGKFEARTSPKWRWSDPGNYEYKNISMLIEIPQRQSIEIDLKNDTWASDNNTEKLEIASFSQLIWGKTDSKENLDEISESTQHLLDYFKQMKTGNFMLPKHHPYYLEKPIDITATHLSLGSGYIILIFLGWILAWPFVLLITKQSKKQKT